MASAAQPAPPAAALPAVIDIDAGSDLSPPPAGPSRESSVLSSPPGDPGSAAASSSGRKKITLSQSKPIKMGASASKAASKKTTQNGNGKVDKDGAEPEPSGSWQPEPEPVPRLVPTIMEDEWVSEWIAKGCSLAYTCPSILQLASPVHLGIH